MDDAEKKRRIIQAAYDDPLIWFQTFGRIRTKDGHMIRPVPNPLQRKIAAAAAWQRKNKKPVRIVALKGRQRGGSTYIQAEGYWKQRRSKTGIKTCILGNQLDTSRNLLAIITRYAQNDTFPWGHDYNANTQAIRFTNGSDTVMETAGDPDAGRSSTLQFLHCSEVAFYPKGGITDGDSIMLGIKKSMGFLPDTDLYLESTANGASGTFYEHYHDAVTLEQAMDGEFGNGFIKIFVPWFMFPEASHPVGEIEGRVIMENLDARERQLVELHNLTASQLKWRRMDIATNCGGSAERFDVEEPSNDKTCWLTAGRPRFNQAALQRMMDWALSQRSTFGTLQAVKKRDSHSGQEKVESAILQVLGDRCTEVSWIQFWELPRLNMRYLISVDPMKGEDQTQSDDPDRHSVLVHRTGYFDSESRIWNKHKIVARIPCPCRDPMDIMAERIHLMSIFWGDCIVVVESNNTGFALLLLLKQLGVNLFKQEEFKLNVSNEAKVVKLGYQTDAFGGREAIMIEMGKRIRENDQVVECGGVDIPCSNIIHECQNTVYWPSGKAAARPGKGHFDDDVISCGMGLVCSAGATTYTEPTLRKGPDWMDDLRRRQGGGSPRGGFGGAFS